MSIRIAVTGRHGQVARALTETGPQLGVELGLPGGPELNLAAPETIGRALTAVAPNIVVNAAAYTAVDQAEREPEIANAINASGAGAVAASARALGVPIIHLSTDYVFDGLKAVPYTEGDEVAPTSVYGASKLTGERVVAAIAFDHVILRTSWVYAPYGKNFVRTMLALAQTRDEVRVVANHSGCTTNAPHTPVAIIAVTR